MKTTQTLTRPVNTRVQALATPDTQRMLMLGQERGWSFSVLGTAPLPTRPVRLRDWLLVPIQDDTSPIPAHTLERVQAIYAAGLRPKGFVLVHEAPLALSAPAGHASSPVTIAEEWGTAWELIKSALSGAVTVGVAVMTVAAMLTLPLTVFVGAIVLDPILIAVTEDDEWIEIDRWWAEPEKGGER